MLSGESLRQNTSQTIISGCHDAFIPVESMKVIVAEPLESSQFVPVYTKDVQAAGLVR